MERYKEEKTNGTITLWPEVPFLRLRGFRFRLRCGGLPCAAGVAAKGIYFSGLFAVVDAINSAIGNRKFLLVNSAGNDDCSLSGILIGPKPSNVLIVGATNINDGKASYSDFGPLVDIAAPGGDFVTPAAPLAWVDYGTGQIEDTFFGRPFAGTSFSAPMVAGAAALVWAKDPTLSAAQVVQRLKSTARSGPDGLGAGILDVGRAVLGNPSNCGEYASFLEGSPCVPGDGLFVSSLDGSDPFFFELSRPYPLAGLANGLTITVFFPVETANFTNLDLIISAPSKPQCQLNVGLIQTPYSVLVNGTPGFATNLPQSELQLYLSILQQQCPTLTMSDLAISSFALHASNGNITILDAATIRTGQNNFPGTR
ncbi:MAG: S8 family peptidase [Blastocatellia bacterium]